MTETEVVESARRLHAAREALDAAHRDRAAALATADEEVRVALAKYVAAKDTLAAAVTPGRVPVVAPRPGEGLGERTLRLLSAEPGRSFTARELAAVLGCRVESLRVALFRLGRQGRVARPETGGWQHAALVGGAVQPEARRG